MSRFELDGAVAVVTGASRGIGPYIARELSEQGARVAVVARSAGELEAVAGEIATAGGSALAVAGDLTKREDRARILATVARELGPADVLINNAGADLQREFHRLSEPEIEGLLELNLHAPILLAHAVLPGMLERGRGHVVNVSSMAGRTSFPFSEAYGAAKDGLTAFTRIWRNDYRARGVSASTLIVGPVGEAGVGARTSEELGLKLPPFLASPRDVARASVRAIRKDKAELVIMPGPAKALRAMMDRFPGLGPALNRAGGVNRTMQRVADYRERQVRQP